MRSSVWGTPMARCRQACASLILRLKGERLGGMMWDSARAASLGFMMSSAKKKDVPRSKFNVIRQALERPDDLYFVFGIY
jgi:hypothetical protein